MKIINEYTKRKQRERNIYILKNALYWIIKTVITLFVAFVLVYFFGIKMPVLNDAMEPTIAKNDVVLVNRISYTLQSPKRGDLILFKPNGNKLAAWEVRRVMGVPGDKIKISSGYVYVNGEKIVDNLPGIKNPGIAKDEIKLKGDDYFVIADNRENMQDSRNPNIGFVRKTYISGKPWFIIKSTERKGFIRIR